MDLNLTPDLIDPATEDWQSMNEAAVYWAAKAGVPEAKVELKRRAS